MLALLWRALHALGRFIRGGVTVLARCALVLAAAWAIYAAWLGERLQISRELIAERARSAQAAVVPRLVAGRDGRAYEAPLELPLYLPPERIPDFVKDAFVTSEDQQFWWHPGVNPVSLVRGARYYGLRAAGLPAGPQPGTSTITMQLVKNLLLSQDRTLDRKFNEIVLAPFIHLMFSREEILAMYINTAYYGEGAYGIEVAARKFFGRSVGYDPKINSFEAAMLAASVRAPARRNPFRQREAIEKLTRTLLASMRAEGYPTPGELPRGPGGRSWKISPSLYRDLAMRFMMPPDLVARDDLISFDLTIDTEAQLYAERGAAEMLNAARDAGYDNSAVIVLEPDGAIVALATGHAYDGRDVIAAGRVSPGSTLKPFMYLCALEHGLRRTDEIADVAREFRPGWTPQNYDRKWLGTITLETALMKSRNPPVVALHQRFGWKCFDEALRRVGIRLRKPQAATAVLGSEYVSLLSLAGAYATLANGGTKVIPYAFKSARTRDGSVIYAHRQDDGETVLEGRPYCDLLSMLRLVTSAQGTGRDAAFAHAVWGKTGTSDSNRDALFAGFTGRYVAVVWLGRQARGAVARGISGGGLPARTFRKVMATLHEGKPELGVECRLRVAGGGRPGVMN